MGRPTKTENRDTRKQLLMTAAQAFGEYGYHKATLADIANQVGVRPRSVLYHFASKEALLDEVVKTYLYEPAATIVHNTLNTELPPAQRLELLLRQISDLWTTQPKLLGVILAEMTQPNQNKQHFLHYIEPLIRQVEEFLRDHMTPPLPITAPLREAMGQFLLWHAFKVCLASELHDILPPPSTDRLLQPMIRLLYQWPEAATEN